MIRIVLASASPRRKMLLSQMGFEFEVIPSKGEEVITSTDPASIVSELSLAKALEVANRLTENGDPGDLLVIGADTIVVKDDKILGKPGDEAEAFEMLTSLSGRTHQVYTGVSLIKILGGRETMTSFAEKTEVNVAKLSPGEIRDYIATKDPMDKAGGYGIQGPFGKYISGITGDYNNVVGLPIAALYQHLKHFI